MPMAAKPPKPSFQEWMRVPEQLDDARLVFPLACALVVMRYHKGNMSWEHLSVVATLVACSVQEHPTETCPCALAHSSNISVGKPGLGLVAE